jgi:hypothetical protein
LPCRGASTGNAKPTAGGEDSRDLHAAMTIICAAFCADKPTFRHKSVSKRNTIADVTGMCEGDDGCIFAFYLAVSMNNY